MYIIILMICYIMKVKYVESGFKNTTGQINCVVLLDNQDKIIVNNN